MSQGLLSFISGFAIAIVLAVLAFWNNENRR